jgi:hypothetical protein
MKATLEYDIDTITISYGPSVRKDSNNYAGPLDMQMNVSYQPTQTNDANRKHQLLPFQNSLTFLDIKISKNHPMKCSDPMHPLRKKPHRSLGTHRPHNTSFTFTSPQGSLRYTRSLRRKKMTYKVFLDSTFSEAEYFRVGGDVNFNPMLS